MIESKTVLEEHTMYEV